MAKSTDTPDDEVVSIGDKRAERDELSALLADIEASCEPDWQQVDMPEWKGRTVWVRSLTAGERSMVLNKGYTQATNEAGETYSKPNGLLQVLIAQIATYVEVGGKKVRVFKPDQVKLIQKLKGPVLDRLVKPVLELSGLTAAAADKARSDFLEDGKSSSDSDSPETWDGVSLD